MKITVSNPALPDDTVFSIPGLNQSLKNGESYETTPEDEETLEREYGAEWKQALHEAGFSASPRSSSSAKKGGE